jgi:hypothetical protein
VSNWWFCPICGRLLMVTYAWLTIQVRCTNCALNERVGWRWEKINGQRAWYSLSGPWMDRFWTQWRRDHPIGDPR